MSTLRPKLSVTHFGKFYPPEFGGIESHLEMLCTATSEAVNVSVIVSNVCAETLSEVVDGVPVTRMATRGLLARAPVTPDVFKLMRSVRSGIVHVHHPNPLATLAVLKSLRPEVGLVVTYHSDIINQRWLRYAFDPVVRAMLRRADAVIATSPNYIEASPILRDFRHKCVPIPLAIDVNGHCASVDYRDVEALRKTVNNPLILAVGRLVPYKGFEFLIDAMADVEGELWIIGDGPLRTQLEARATSMKQKIRFLGKVPCIANYCAAADVLALSSINRSEAFGIVQLEAMALGKPVINTQLDSGVPFVSVDGETGFTVPPCDSKALAAALNRVLYDADLRSRQGAAAQLRASRLFDVRPMARNTVAVYANIAAKRWPSKFDVPTYEELALRVGA